ncbi:R-SNARE protein, VAMP72-family [Coccomyxa subellipsoidea C-169]|uniref:R-SNARE protein, VAMP72-family n=1 Tax=Coccomyxa subellipsoidea (strain C-169) TaxID=574566 RepID=I0YLI1_COCSC|nr:R-SNARE protein, VAMP72-family [Coccomyxa subellipsoidea C-169]EIE19250.1 R-SNARE protein, VAMP72-family [Coccomyxa subellipsoidea C-169]|eukprot:XP_005643794.1 R-SNARE protein, VAMP72-family [Coccomyxa subellipsoidea C-169]
MPLIYAFVSRGTTVLADYTTYTGNFATVAIQCLDKLNTSSANSKVAFNCDHHTFNYLVDGGYTYLVVADEKFGRQIPFAFLDKVKAEFAEKHAESSRTLHAHSLDKIFGPRLKYWMDYCQEHPDEMNKIASVQKKVDEVKNIMVDNIEKVLERGEKIELLVDKTDNLRFQADRFHKTGRQLRSKMWWQNMKMKLIIAAVVVVLAFIIFLMACFSGRNCLKH